jgi:hypothetical protein
VSEEQEEKEYAIIQQNTAHKDSAAKPEDGSLESFELVGCEAALWTDLPLEDGSGIPLLPRVPPANEEGKSVLNSCLYICFVDTVVDVQQDPVAVASRS